MSGDFLKEADVNWYIYTRLAESRLHCALHKPFEAANCQTSGEGTGDCQCHFSGGCFSTAP